MRRIIFAVTVLALISLSFTNTSPSRHFFKSVPTIVRADGDNLFGVGACSKLTQETPRTSECDAEIEANPLPEMVHPVEYDEKRDGQGHPRSIMLPKEPLPFPIAWQKRPWYFSDAPGVLPADNDWTNARLIGHYAMYYAYAVVEADNALWYLIGPGQWMKDEFVSVLQIPERPEEVSGPWVAIDVTQQTLVAFVDDTPVYATLVSTGYWILTETGLFQVYARTLSTTMSGPPGANPPEYVLPATPWVQFFNHDEALHGAYYHNYFGMKRSHGCVNLSPGDAEWVWNFFEQTADEWHPSGSDTFFVDNPDKAPWVLVYESPDVPVSVTW
ncbi:MAG: L,D-transpeptidase [Anaerolineae bacterium]|nr:L,D-transpeptidase [Anaerolineae bacterium]